MSPRGLWRFNRYFILIAFVAGAVLTPGDLVVGQIAMAGALTVLYNLSILVALFVVVGALLLGLLASGATRPLTPS